MVLLAPLAEELLFRGYLYGKLRKTAPVWLSVLVASVAFGLAHLWVGSGPLQWAVAIDTFVLSLMLCALREYTGAVWAGVLLHAIKNGLAFYLLFVNPSVVDQIKAALLPLL
jgi:membrane protease YdiL (CAAX protease family)